MSSYLAEADVDLPGLRARLLSKLSSARSRSQDEAVEVISFSCTSSFIVVVVVAVGFVAVCLCYLLYVRRLV